MGFFKIHARCDEGKVLKSNGEYIVSVNWVWVRSMGEIYEKMEEKNKP